jgi:hypothetical protein
VLMVLAVGVVVCAMAGVAIMAAMARAPYRCDLMFRLRIVREELGRRALVPTTSKIGRETPTALS